MRFRTALFVSLCCLLTAPAFAAEEAGAEFFEKKIRPILATRCLECHRTDPEGKHDPKGGLRLDSREALMAGGDTGPAIVSGDPKNSLLIDAINYGATYQMPPKSRMPVEEVALLTKWVEMGAPWPEDPTAKVGGVKKLDLAERKAAHWAWKQLQPPALPEVKHADRVRQPLDRLVLSKVEAAGFEPAPPADKRTLIRRLTFDLTGLPPTPTEVADYLNDNAPHATEKVVDRLLASPKFGERFARHWLDLVRYAESRGHEFDPDVPDAYQYRDYVIRAFNADVPYDQFVVEHVAGDLLPQPRLHPTEGFDESILGTGFWFLGEWVHSPVDIRKDETDRFDNMVDVFSKTFLGLTVSCARCHDHKFDAISQADYHALCGYLQSSGYRLARFDTDRAHRNIAEELDALNAKHGPALAKATAARAKAGMSQLPAYLLATRKTLQETPAKEWFENKEETKLAPTLKMKIDAVADEAKLDRGTLVAWTEKVLAARKNPDDLLHGWSVLCQTTAITDEQTRKAWQAFVTGEQQRQNAAANALAKTQSILEFQQLDLADWRVNGPLFGLGPTKPGALRFGDEGVTGVAWYAAAMRDPVWNGLSLSPQTQNDPNGLGRLIRAGKTIRTPTFKLEQPAVHYLVRGAGLAYAAVDSHGNIAGPLHGGILRDLGPDHAGLRWIGHDLAPYVGHRIHVELTAKDDQPFEVLAVVQGSPAGQPLAAPTHAAGRPLGQSDFADAAAIAAGYQSFLNAAADALAANQLDQSEFQFAADWLAKNLPLLPANADDAAKFAHEQKTYADARKAITSRIRRDSHLAPAMWDGSGEDDQLLIRGNTKTVGAVVPRRLLTVLEEDLSAAGFTAGPQTDKSGSGRIDLARKLVHPANPFTSRVIANRAWYWMFGRGIVPSTDNFGVLGQAPTHPELLDLLALQMQHEGWSLKKLLRAIALSNTYQQSSAPAAAKVEESDPDNLLWRRTNVRRLQGEAIRDAMLAVSGRLDPTLYGPAVPVHLTEFMQGRGRPGSGPLDGAGRRSLYLSVRRNFLSPMMLTFDTPIPFSTVGRRNVSNVPAQALMLMNDKFVIEQAKLWAKNALAVKDQSPEQRIAALYERAFSRPPTADEVAAALAFLQTQAAELKLPPDRAATDERIWSDLCHVLWNFKEFVFVN